ncbi:MAG: hypothetical protein IJW49_08665 [Clostridia bacterium]|nr:hypothetical protein [Clostridia bacterium]
MKTVDKNYFPGWVRKSITFTIDDGNVKLDRKFLDITEPAGLKGTFNLNTPLKRLDAEGYRDFYRGYEITNHCRFHPKAMTPELQQREVKEEPFDKETADPSFAYKIEDGIYRIYIKYWDHVAEDEKYIDCVLEATKELEEVFGKGAIRDYVWPYCEQPNVNVVNKVKSMGFRSIRKTGCVKDSTGFSLPLDRMAWSYNANNTNLRELSKAYDAYPDDGTLKFFCFGVHSHDFENANCWDVLEDFCRDMGNRPNDFWYASVGEIFDYEDAVKALVITENEIKNDSPIDLYVKIDGEPTLIKANSVYML